MTNENPSPTKPDPEKYNRLVAHAKIQTIRLLSSRFDLKPIALTASREDWDYNITHQLVDWHCDNESLTLSGTWVYTATCVQGRRKLLSVSAKYLTTYSLSAVCDEEAGHQFLERVSRFAAYPYFRGTFALLTQQCGVLLHPLPVISEQPRWVTPPPQGAERPKSRRTASAKPADSTKRRRNVKS